jgi:hypothetical protein
MKNSKICNNAAVKTSVPVSTKASIKTGALANTKALIWRVIILRAD